jgi:hypothetical protein
MRFRPSLDLNEILADYEVFGGRAPRYTPWIEPPEPVAELPEGPYRMGPGDRLLATSGTGMAPFRPTIWDVNGYYRALDVHPYATRKGLREAYQARGGPDDAYLTYVFKQLLNEAVRRSYDAMALGELFLDDYTADELKRRAAAEASRRAAEGFPVSADDVLDEMGYVILDETEAGELEQLDTEERARQDKSYQESWGWSYYLWGTRESDDDTLRAWQTALVEELSVRRRTVRFAVGSRVAEPSRNVGFTLQREDEHFVFFLKEGAYPGPLLAADAVDAYIERAESN